jgi:cephalosporin hydroxylase
MHTGTHNGGARVGVRLRRFVQRAIRFVKPPPAYRPLTLDEIMGAQQGLNLVQQFNDLWYRSGVAGQLSWRGDPIVKNPCDLWMVIELFQRLKPAAVIETGTHFGGSASFYADMLRIQQIPSTVITVDINPKWSFDPASKGIVSVVGYSVDEKVVDSVGRALASATAGHDGHVIVMLDSDHTEENVTKELALYSKFVTPESYLIVEDTNINGHPSSPEFGPGPWEAVQKFLRERSDFIADPDCERFLLTFYPRGWLKRVRR